MASKTPSAGTKVLESFKLSSPEHEHPVTVALIEGLDDSHILNIEQRWRALFARQRNLALRTYFSLPTSAQTPEKWIELQGSFDIQDQEWDWRKKRRFAPGTNSLLYGISNAADLEAAMMLSLGATSHDQFQPLPLVHVDFLAIAPWSRKAIKRPPRFKGLGSILIGRAVATSIEKGLEGRCGLASLPQAEGFYRRIGMREFPVTTGSQSLKHFEFSAEAARQFITKGVV